MAENTSTENAVEGSSTVSTGNGDGNQVQNGTDQSAQPAQQPAPRQNMWSILKTLVVRMLFIYFIASLFKRSPQTNTTTDGTAGSSIMQKPSSNVYSKDMRMDMYVYVSEQEHFTDFKNPDALFWTKRALVYGDWTSGLDGDGSYVHSDQIKATPTIQSNGSVYLHVYFVKAGKLPDPDEKGKFSRKTTVYRSKRLNKFKKRFFHNTVNLLTGETDVHPDLIKRENSSSFEVLSHWHPNMTINLLDDYSPWIEGHVPAPLDEYIDFIPGTDKYFPVLYLNDYWNLNSHYMPVNDTVTELNLTLTYSPISLFRWQIYAAQGMRNKWYSFMGSDLIEENDDDQDSLKTAFLETNPYLLAMTIVVSLLHSVFEFLAFKNDIQFWKSRKSLEGLSVRSVFFNVFQSLIVLLYVMDNETNTVVRISVFVGLCIEIWKIHKVVNVKFDRENLLFGVLPRLSLGDKSSYTESMTKKYDTLAFKYLSWLLFPLLGVYAVYSLLYNEHKGWYSFVLGMMYGFLLTFGFIMMTPQLFINYKLKSVAHLPWRMLTYKALNTFIDDIFAFVIKMPTLYRLGCLRDDVIFFIYVYQRYIYKIDPKRVNEYGTSQDMFDENAEVKTEDQAAIKAGSATEGETPAIEKPATDSTATENPATDSTATDSIATDSTATEPKPAEEKKND
ncbi:cleft lip and palate transmembrane protein 1 homolog [Haliotis rufescens]|uniref:cleft lip and palate transmembrane protein 1 homolog n=1 Tax=Haliotis rufescens TaxID=6454 RepID=UPI001EAF944A|nr:cleft lip and palate transmembrane protein 1 homolog [Haliotis rufescens]